MGLPALSASVQLTPSGMVPSATVSGVPSAGSLLTVHLMVVLSASEHTSGPESRATVTPGAVRAVTSSVLMSSLAQPVTPGVSVWVVRTMEKSSQPATPEVSTGTLHCTEMVVPLATVHGENGGEVGSRAGRVQGSGTQDAWAGCTALPAVASKVTQSNGTATAAGRLLSWCAALCSCQVLSSALARWLCFVS